MLSNDDDPPHQYSQREEEHSMRASLLPSIYDPLVLGIESGLFSRRPAGSFLGRTCHWNDKGNLVKKGCFQRAGEN